MSGATLPSPQPWLAMSIPWPCVATAVHQILQGTLFSFTCFHFHLNITIFFKHIISPHLQFVSPWESQTHCKDHPEFLLRHIWFYSHYYASSLTQQRNGAGGKACNWHRLTLASICQEQQEHGHAVSEGEMIVTVGLVWDVDGGSGNFLYLFLKLC